MNGDGGLTGLIERRLGVVRELLFGEQGHDEVVLSLVYVYGVRLLMRRIRATS